MTQHKVHFFLSSLHLGGAETFYTRLANMLAARGFSVTVLLIRKAGALVEELSPDVRIVDLGVYGEKWAALPRLASYIRTERPSVVVSVLTEPNLMLILATALIRRKPRRVISVRSDLNSSLSRANRTSRRMALYRPLIRHLYPCADRILAVSEGVAASVVKVVGSHVVPKISTIPNGVRIQERTPDYAALERRRNRGISNAIVACGSLKPAKGFDLLIRAFAAAKRRIPGDAELWIVGDGAELCNLQKIASSLGVLEGVWFVGRHARPTSIYAAADLFVLSSRYEGMPNVLLEALSVGVPVVSTDCESGPREVLQCGEFGRLVPIDDVKALADAIVDHLACEHDRRKLIGRASEYSLDAVCDSYISVLAER